MLNELLMKKHFNRAVAMVVTAAASMFASCDSALSDVEVTDPSLLMTNFIVGQTVFDDGSTAESLHATIFDKNLASVELKNGKVRVNGQQMSMTEILNIKTYHIPGASVDLNKTYEFELILPNGDVHRGTVTSQPKALTAVTVPTDPSINEDLTISWQETYAHDDFIISVNLTSPSGTVPGPTFTLTPSQMEEGSFVIPKSTFATPAGITSATISLTGAAYGTIDPKFRTGSGTISRMRLEKKVTFK